MSAAEVEGSDGPAAPAQRMEELARVTQAFGTFSQASGLPLAALGGWLLVGTLATDTIAGRCLLLLSPLAWIGAEAVSVRLYTAHGAVVAIARWQRWAGLFLVLVWGWLWVDEIHFARWYRPLPTGLMQGLAIAVLVAVALAAIRSERRGRYAYGAWITLFAAAQLGTRDTVRPLEGSRGWLALGWALLVAVGVLTHLRFRRLERRMAVLRGEAP
jgi:hypothetical protein